MQITIIFYSFSGNTKKASEYLRCELQKINHVVTIQELKLQNPEQSSLRQCQAARNRETPDLKSADYYVSNSDLIIFASPVWAFTFTPALRTYLINCAELQGKKVAIFLTCGAAITSGEALKELQESITMQGAQVVFAEYISGYRAQDPKYLYKKFRPLLQ